LAEFLPVKHAFAHQLTESANHSLTEMRAAYSLAPHITYFNHGSIGTTPKIVQQAHKGYLDLCETNPHLYMWGEPWQITREQTREKAANYLGCGVDEVAFTHNTTEPKWKLSGFLSWWGKKAPLFFQAFVITLDKRPLNRRSFGRQAHQDFKQLITHENRLHRRRRRRDVLRQLPA
jgi:hypothetical protein